MQFRDAIEAQLGRVMASGVKSPEMLPRNTLSNNDTGYSQSLADNLGLPNIRNVHSNTYAAIAAHEAGHFAENVESGKLPAYYYVKQTSGVTGVRITGKTPMEAAVRHTVNTVSGAASESLLMGYSAPGKQSGHLSDILAYTNLLNPQVTDQSQLNSRHVENFYKAVDARMQELKPYSQPLQEIAQAMHDQPYWLSERTYEDNAPSMREAGFKVSASSTRIPQQMMSAIENFTSEMGVPMPREMSSLTAPMQMAPMLTPSMKTGHVDASLVGNPFRALTRMFGGELETGGGRAPQDIVESNAKALVGLSGITGINKAGRAGPRDPALEGVVGGVSFRAKPNLITEGEGGLRNWKVVGLNNTQAQTWGASPADMSQAEVAGRVAQQNNVPVTGYGVMGFNRDVYDQTLGKRSSVSAKQQAMEAALRAVPFQNQGGELNLMTDDYSGDDNSSRLGRALSTLRRGASAIEGAGVTVRTGRDRQRMSRAEKFAEEKERVGATDSVVKALAGKGLGKSLGMYEADMAEGVDNEAVRNALYMGSGTGSGKAAAALGMNGPGGGAGGAITINVGGGAGVNVNISGSGGVNVGTGQSGGAGSGGAGQPPPAGPGAPGTGPYAGGAFSPTGYTTNFMLAGYGNKGGMIGPPTPPQPSPGAGLGMMYQPSMGGPLSSLRSTAAQAVDAVGNFPMSIVNKRWAIRGIQQEFLQPMEQNRQAYLQSQQGAMGSAAQFDIFGGTNFAGSQAYQQAFRPSVAAGSYNMALGAAAQRGYGNSLTALTNTFGTENVASAQILGEMTMAGGAIGGMVAGPAGAAVAGTIGLAAGGVAYGAGQAITYNQDRQQRIDLAMSDVKGESGNIAGMFGRGLNVLGGRVQSVFGNRDREQQLKIQYGSDTIAAKRVMALQKGMGGPLADASQDELSALYSGYFKDSQNVAPGLDPEKQAQARGQVIGRTMNVFSGTKGGSGLVASINAIYSAQASGVDPFAVAESRLAANGLAGMDESNPRYRPALLGALRDLSSPGGLAQTSLEQSLSPSQNKIRDLQASVGQKTTAYTGQDMAKILTDARNSNMSLSGIQDLNQRLSQKNTLDTSMATADSNLTTQGSAYSTYMYSLAGQGGRPGAIALSRAMNKTSMYEDWSNSLQAGSTSAGLADAALTSYARRTSGLSAGASNAGLSISRNLGYGAASQQAVNFAQMTEQGVNATAGSSLRTTYGIDYTASRPFQKAVSLAQSGPGGTYQANQVMQNIGTVESMYSQYRAYGSDPGNAMYNNLMGRANTMTTAQMQVFQNVASGNAIANSLYADAGGQAWRRTIQTGSQGGTQGMAAGYDERISRSTAQERSAFASQYGLYNGGAYTGNQLSSMNQMQLQSAQNREQVRVREYDFGLQQRQQYRAQSSMYAEFGFEDRGVSLGRGQQDFQRQQQRASLSMQEQQSSYSYQHQTQEMGIQYGHQQQEQQWGLQNLAFQRNTSQISFGYSMIDADEAVRYSTGRNRRTAMRHRDEAVTMQAMNMGQMDKEEQRAKERIKWADDQYNRDKDHAAKEYEFTKKNFDLQEQNYAKEGEFIKEQRKLEDDQRVYRRNIAVLEMNETIQSMNVHQESKRTMDELANATMVANNIEAQHSAELQYRAQTGGLAMDTLGSAVINMANNAWAAVSLINSISFNDNAIRPAGGGTGRHDYAAGGYTGRGGKYEAAGTVHKGEYVIPQEGAPVIMSRETTDLLKKIHSVLQDIQNGGNAIVQINQTNPATAKRQAMSIYDKAFR